MIDNTQIIFTVVYFLVFLDNKETSFVYQGKRGFFVV